MPPTRGQKAAKTAMFTIPVNIASHHLTPARLRLSGRGPPSGRVCGPRLSHAVKSEHPLPSYPAYVPDRRFMARNGWAAVGRAIVVQPQIPDPRPLRIHERAYIGMADAEYRLTASLLAFPYRRGIITAYHPAGFPRRRLNCPVPRRALPRPRQQRLFRPAACRVSERSAARSPWCPRSSRPAHHGGPGGRRRA